MLANWPANIVTAMARGLSISERIGTTNHDAPVESRVDSPGMRIPASQALVVHLLEVESRSSQRTATGVKMGERGPHHP